MRPGVLARGLSGHDLQTLDPVLDLTGPNYANLLDFACFVVMRAPTSLDVVIADSDDSDFPVLRRASLIQLKAETGVRLSPI